MTHYANINAFVDVPAIMADPFVVQACKNWFDNLNKYYLKNFKNI